MSTEIEWTNETVNLITGCTKYSEGCQNCYAEKMHARLSGMKQEKYRFPFNNVIFHYKELGKKIKGKNKMIFVNSMSDTFHEKISDNQIDKILDFCKSQPQHIFQILTKRADRINNFSYPENVWLGVTVETNKYKKRIEFLKKTNAKIKFISCEPLLRNLGKLDLIGIDWVICGGESGYKARPCHPDWVKSIQQQCEEKGVAFFFKQWGEWKAAKQKPPFEIENPIYSKLSAKIMLNDGTIIDGISSNDVKKWEKQTLRSIDGKNAVIILKVGKQKSGALLDGIEYKQYPRKED